MFLFNSYCKPSYGLALWNSKTLFSRCIFKSFNVAFNNNLKRMLGVPLYASNHVTAERCEQFLLKHHIALLQCNYYFRLLRSQVFLIKMNLPFLRKGYFFNHVNNLFFNIYNIVISECQTDIVKSRITFVQNHEDRRGRCPYFLI